MGNRAAPWSRLASGDCLEREFRLIIDTTWATGKMHWRTGLAGTLAACPLWKAWNQAWSQEPRAPPAPWASFPSPAGSMLSEAARPARHAQFHGDHCPCVFSETIRLPRRGRGIRAQPRQAWAFAGASRVSMILLGPSPALQEFIHRSGQARWQSQPAFTGRSQAVGSGARQPVRPPSNDGQPRFTRNVCLMPWRGV